MTEAILPSKKGNAKNWGLLAVAAAIIVVAALMPDVAGLTFGGRMSLALMLSGIVCMIGGAMPLAIISVAMMALQPFFGICSFNEAFSNSMSSTVFLIMGTFIFTVALQKTTIPTRVIGVVLQKAQTNTKAVLLGLMGAVFVLSMFVTNNAATAMSMPIVLALIEANHCIKGESNMSKAFMVCMPLAAFYGGMSTLSGCAINVMAVGLLEANFGYTVTYLTWLIIGLPLGIILVLLTWFIATHVFKLESLSQEAVDSSLKEYHALHAIEGREKMVLLIIGLTVVCWIASTWVPIFNTAAVCLLACFLFFLPGQKIMEFDDAIKGVNWSILLLIMGVNSLAASMTATGASTWLVNTLMGGVAGVNPIVVMLIASAVVCLVHNLVPVGPAVAGITVIPLLTLALSTGVSLTCMTVMLGWWGGVAFVIPLDCVTLIAYAYGYFTFTDFMKVGAIPTLVTILYSGTVVPLLCSMMGLV